MNQKTDMREALQLCIDAMLHDGVPTDPYHPRQVALTAAEAALACQSQGVPVAWQVRRADGRIDGVPIQWECCTKELYETTLATGRYAGYENGPLCEVRALFAAAPAPVSAPSPDREQVGEALGLSYQSCALLLNVLWHHQGGSSTVGQPIRTMLGIGQYDHLTEEQLSEAKRIEGMLAWHEAPDALPFRECGEKKPAGPADQAIYQAIADNYTRESAELGRPLSDFERVVLEYIAFNDGFINTRIRARQMLDGVGGERQGASAPTLGDGKPNLVDRVDDAMRARLGPNYCPPSGEPDNSFLSPVSAAVPQPQAAEPKRLTDEQIERAALAFVKKPGMQGYVEPGDLIDFARTLLAKGE